jgi:hypothetical protein
MKTSFAEIISNKINKLNKKRARNVSLIESILAQNQAGAKSGPIALSALIKR